jgi:hypothetical protein
MCILSSSAIVCLFNCYLRGTIKILMYKNLPYPAAYTPHTVVAVVVVPVKYFAIYTTTRTIHKLYATNNYYCLASHYNQQTFEQDLLSLIFYVCLLVSFHVGELFHAFLQLIRSVTSGHPDFPIKCALKHASALIVHNEH